MNNEVDSNQNTIPNNNNIMTSSTNEVTIKQFVGYSLLIGFLNVIGAIIVLVIGNNKNNKTISNYAIASLIMFGIAVVLAIIFVILISMIGLGASKNNINDVEDYINNSGYNYTYDYDDYYDYD